MNIEDKYQDMKKVELFFTYINKIKSELKNHEYLNLDKNGMGNYNSDKKLKQEFVDRNFYVSFLEELLKPEDQHLKDEDVCLFVEDVLKEAEDLKVLGRSLLEKEVEIKKVFQSASEDEDEEQRFLELKKRISARREMLQTFSDIPELKNFTKDDLDGKIKMLTDNTLKCLTNYSLNCTEGKLIAQIGELLAEEIKLLLDIGQSLGLNCGNQPQTFPTGELSYVEVVIEAETYEVLEIYFTNDLGKRSSLEVKLMYVDQRKETLLDIVVPNSPIDLTDLTQLAIRYNDFTNFLPEIQHRLSES